MTANVLEYVKAMHVKAGPDLNDLYCDGCGADWPCTTTQIAEDRSLLIPDRIVKLMELHVEQPCGLCIDEPLDDCLTACAECYGTWPCYTKMHLEGNH